MNDWKQQIIFFDTNNEFEFWCIVKNAAACEIK